MSRLDKCHKKEQAWYAAAKNVLDGWPNADQLFDVGMAELERLVDSVESRCCHMEENGWCFAHDYEPW